MAELLLRLEIDPITGKKNVVIDYGSDEDALPMEHEEDHRRFVDALIEGGALRASELGQIVIRRDGEGALSEPSTAEEAVEQAEALGTTDP